MTAVLEPENKPNDDDPHNEEKLQKPPAIAATAIQCAYLNHRTRQRRRSMLAAAAATAARRVDMKRRGEHLRKRRKKQLSPQIRRYRGSSTESCTASSSSFLSTNSEQKKSRRRRSSLFAWATGAANYQDDDGEDLYCDGAAREKPLTSTAAILPHDLIQSASSHRKKHGRRRSSMDSIGLEDSTGEVTEEDSEDDDFFNDDFLSTVKENPLGGLVAFSSKPSSSSSNGLHAMTAAVFQSPANTKG